MNECTVHIAELSHSTWHRLYDREADGEGAIDRLREEESRYRSRDSQGGG